MRCVVSELLSPVCLRGLSAPVKAVTARTTDWRLVGCGGKERPNGLVLVGKRDQMDWLQWDGGLVIACRDNGSTEELNQEQTGG